MTEWSREIDKSAVVCFLYTENLKGDQLVQTIFNSLHNDKKNILRIKVKGEVQTDIEFDEKFWKVLPTIVYQDETVSKRKRLNFLCALENKIPKFQDQVKQRKGKSIFSFQRQRSTIEEPLLHPASTPNSPHIDDNCENFTFDANTRLPDDSNPESHLEQGSVLQNNIEPELEEVRVEIITPGYKQRVNGVKNHSPVNAANSHDTRNSYDLKEFETANTICHFPGLADTEETKPMSIFPTTDNYNSDTHFKVNNGIGNRKEYNETTCTESLGHNNDQQCHNQVNVARSVSEENDDVFSSSGEYESKKPTSGKVSENIECYGSKTNRHGIKLSKSNSNELNRPMLSKGDSENSSASFSSGFSEFASENEQRGQLFSADRTIHEEGDNSELGREENNKGNLAFEIRNDRQGRTGSPESGYSTSVPLTGNVENNMVFLKDFELDA